MKTENISVNFTGIKFKLGEKTMQTISKSTKLTKEELTNLSLEEQIRLMDKRGTLKKPNPVKTFLVKQYIKLGEKLGLLPKDRYIHTDID